MLPKGSGGGADVLSAAGRTVLQSCHQQATVTVALVLLQIGWLLWAFFSLTAGKVWVNAGLNVLSLFITLYLVRKDENSDYKIIWLVLIGMMPLLGGALYLAFGNKAPRKRMRPADAGGGAPSTPPTSPSSRPDRRPRPRQQGTEPVCFGVRAVPRMEKLHGKILPLR